MTITMNKPSFFVFPNKNRYEISVEEADLRLDILTDFRVISLFRRLFLAATANIDAFTKRNVQKNPIDRSFDALEGKHSPSDTLMHLWQKAEYWQMVDDLKDLYGIGRSCLSSLFQISVLLQYLYAQTKNRDLLWLFGHIGKTMESLVTCPFMDIFNLRIPFEQLQLLGQDLHDVVSEMFPDIAPLLGIIHRAPALHETLAQAREIMELDTSPHSDLISMLLPELSIPPALDFFALCSPLLTSAQAYSTKRDRIQNNADYLGFDLPRFCFGTRSLSNLALLATQLAGISFGSLRYIYKDLGQSLRMPSIALECNLVVTILYDRETSVPFELPLRGSVSMFEFRRRAGQCLQQLQLPTTALDRILERVKNEAPNIRQMQHQNDLSDVKRTVQNSISTVVSPTNNAIFTTLWNEFMFEIGLNAAEARLHSVGVNARQYHYFISLAAPSLVAVDSSGHEIMRSHLLEDFLRTVIEPPAQHKACMAFLEETRIHDLENRPLVFFNSRLPIPELAYEEPYADILKLNGIEPANGGPDHSYEAYYPRIPGIAVHAGTFALSTNQIAPNSGGLKKDREASLFSINN